MGWKNLHGLNVSWYVKLVWATIIGVKCDLPKYAASQWHVNEGKANMFARGGHFIVK